MVTGVASHVSKTERWASREIHNKHKQKLKIIRDLRHECHHDSTMKICALACVYWIMPRASRSNLSMHLHLIDYNYSYLIIITNQVWMSRSRSLLLVHLLNHSGVNTFCARGCDGFHLVSELDLRDCLQSEAQNSRNLKDIRRIGILVETSRNREALDMTKE